MLNLTRQEVLVIQFLVGFFLLGTAIHLYRSCGGQSETVQREQDRRDAEFAQFSRQIDSVTPVQIPVKAAEPESEILPGSKIELNTATKDELMRLPGIGPTIAERIILYREDIDGFRKVEDLLGVKGIGEKTLERIKDEVTIE